MTLYKKGTISSSIIVSSSIYSCEKCGHTKIVKNRVNVDDDPKCPKCGSMMTLTSCQTESVEK